MTLFADHGTCKLLPVASECAPHGAPWMTGAHAHIEREREREMIEDFRTRASGNPMVAWNMGEQDVACGRIDVPRSPTADVLSAHPSAFAMDFGPIRHRRAGIRAVVHAWGPESAREETLHPSRVRRRRPPREARP